MEIEEEFISGFCRTCNGGQKISSYRRKSIAAPENFHFTIPVFISVLLYAGGIY